MGSLTAIKKDMLRNNQTRVIQYGLDGEHDITPRTRSPARSLSLSLSLALNERLALAREKRCHRSFFLPSVESMSD